jgi:hypothetical protein
MFVSEGLSEESIFLINCSLSSDFKGVTSENISSTTDMAILYALAFVIIAQVVWYGGAEASAPIFFRRAV